MQHPKVFCIGDLNIDLFTHAGTGQQKNTGLVFGEEHSAKKIYYSLGGNAANFAAAISSLGTNTYLASAIGRDIFSSPIMKELGKRGMKPLLKRYDLPNGVSNIFVSESGERAILSSKGCLTELQCRDIENKALPKLREGDIVFFGGYFHMLGMHRGFPELLRRIRTKGAKIFFDACFDTSEKWKVGHFLGLVDCFFLNEVEMRKICGTKNVANAVKKLFSMGARRIVLKKGAKGSEFFSADCHETMAAIGGRAMNATGAGDFFNAGFTFGFLRGFSIINCLLAGNFVASQKIYGEGYACTSRRQLDSFLARRNLASVEVVKDYSAMSRRAAGIIAKQLGEKPDSVLCLAAGKTPTGTYRTLVKMFRRGNADFSRASFIELDEYLGLHDIEDSFGHFLENNLFGKVNFRRKNIFMFSQNPINLNAECRRFDSLVKNCGIDLLLLGIGENGHIAYNEPGTAFSSRTHIVKLSPKVLGQRGKKFLGPAPRHAITLGLKAILSASKIVLIASGSKKAKALQRAMNWKPGPKVPASVLQLHGNAAIIADNRAAKYLRK
ncbi:putative sugar kinase [uncultured archaeon]|nr:putative sugar kinase [uncultured archaeon]